MADEFIKGLAILTVSGTVWFTVAAWYRTDGFGGTQLIAPRPDEDLGTYGEALLVIGDIALYFALIGAITFWVLVPAFREGRRAWDERQRAE